MASIGLQNYLSCRLPCVSIINGVVVFDERKLVQATGAAQWYQFQKTQFDTDDIDESR